MKSIAKLNIISYSANFQQFFLEIISLLCFLVFESAI
jgi:hypothetical protein